MDSVPFCIYKEQIKKECISDSTIKEKRLNSKVVKRITDQQLSDGSWDRFHTLSARSTTRITTENAIRRLLVLGLGKKDIPLQKAFSYMEQYLLRQIDYRDHKESFSDWREINELFTATWMLEIDSTSSIAGKVADKWASLITKCFGGPLFNYMNYLAAFQEIFNVKAGKRVWNIESFHIVSIVRNRLDPLIEDRFIRHILNDDRGLYYMPSSGKLASIPSEFMSRSAVSFVWSHHLLSRYPSYSKYSVEVYDWLMANQSDDGLWDFGSNAKDDVFLPYSDSWRKKINRKIDSTILVQRYLQSIRDGLA